MDARCLHVVVVRLAMQTSFTSDLVYRLVDVVATSEKIMMEHRTHATKSNNRKETDCCARKLSANFINVRNVEIWEDQTNQLKKFHQRKVCSAFLSQHFCLIAKVNLDFFSSIHSFFVCNFGELAGATGKTFCREQVAETSRRHWHACILTLHKVS